MKVELILLTKKSEKEMVKLQPLSNLEKHKYKLALQMFQN